MQTAPINIQYSNNHDETPVACIAFGDFESSGNAMPTSRLLEGSDDHRFAEEWVEPGHVTINGERRPARLVYLFTANEITDEAENYPWDAEHVARILLAD